MTHRWSIVGTGRVARQTARAIDAVDGHEVVAVAGRTLDSATQFIEQARMDAALPAASIPGLLPAAPDLVYIASPNDYHEQHIREALVAELAVLCEKPLAADAATARRIGEAARHPGARVAVGFQYRQHPAHRRARELIAAGALGDVRAVQVTACLPALDVPHWYDDPAASGGGILPMSGVHRVDIVRYILDADFRRVQATTAHHRRRPFDDSAAIVAELEGEVMASFVFGLDMPYGDDRISVHGTEGSLTLESTMSQWWSAAPGTLTMRDASGVRVSEFTAVDTYALQIAAFALFADGTGGSATMAVIDDGVAAAEFTDAVYRSAAGGIAVDLE